MKNLFPIILYSLFLVSCGLNNNNFILENKHQSKCNNFSFPNSIKFFKYNLNSIILSQIEILNNNQILSQEPIIEKIDFIDCLEKLYVITCHNEECTFERENL